jgi:hypothetical protein
MLNKINPIYTMKKLFTFALVLIATCLQAQDPTATQIIDKYLTAIGGKDAVAKIEDMIVSSSSEMNRNGQAITMDTEAKIKGKKFISVTYAMGNESNRIICDGNKVFMTGRMGGGDRTLEGTDAVIPMLQGALFPELLYSDYKIAATLQGKEAINGKDAWKIECATAEGKKWITFYDVESGLKIRTSVTNESPRGTMTQNTTLSNYKEVGGIKIPYTRTRSFGQFEMKDEVGSVKVNKGIKDSVFEIK